MGFEEELAERIRTAREARGLSQKDLSNALGLRDATVSDWERRQGVPKAANLVVLAPLLGVSVQWLMTGSEVPPSSPPPPMSVLHDFLETPLGKTLSEHERAFLQELKFTDKPPTEATYVSFVAGLRGTR